MQRQLIVSASPHIRQDTSVEKVMYGVVIALVPALAGAFYFYGPRALILTLIAAAVSISISIIFPQLSRLLALN